MMQARDPLKLVIVGGGTAGWMTAAALAKVLKGKYSITLVESDEIGTIGVGEATIPMISLFNRLLELDEDEFMRKTQATFKLGIEFVNWGRLGDRYIHGFGVIGQDNWTVDFHQYWLKQFKAGKAKPLEYYSINTAACYQNKFCRPRRDIPNSPLGDIAYAFHFDAGLYAKFLREFSEARGVKRVEGKIEQAHVDPVTGNINSVTLQSKQTIDGEFFIDCSGFKGLLIEEALKTGYEKWDHWLPCDRAQAVPCQSVSPLTPYTRSTARQAGWQWRIPLQHRIGNGHVYCSSHMSDDEAASILLQNLDGAPLADPRVVKFMTGRRNKAWNKNVVSIGLSSGFLEPLESTSIHLIQMGIGHLLTYFPATPNDVAESEGYNAAMKQEFKWVRDFIILHYKATERTDTDFWNYVRTMSIPDSLMRRIELYKNYGRVFREGNELFAKPSWIQVMHGQRVEAKNYHPLTDLLTEKEIADYLDEVAGVIDHCIGLMPSHEKFIAEHCAANMVK
jgi:tryptophan halogenase